jgi:hypothetical protein
MQITSVNFGSGNGYPTGSILTNSTAFANHSALE